MIIKNKKILITGGSAGIGKAVIAELIKYGATEFAVISRKKEPLEKLREEFNTAKFLLIQGNVADLEDLDRAVEQVQQKWGKLDILVNNAGVVSAGLLKDLSDQDIIGQINVNLTGLILLTKKVLPLLKDSSEGAIINVSSGYGYIAMPFYSVYAATKAAVGQFSDAMRRELHQYPLHVMTVYPSATETNMMKTADVGGMDSPQEVAKRTVDGLISGEINVILGGEERKKHIELNFNNPRKIDEAAIANYEALEKRTRNHRSM
ncbi:SDR family NAD(P)-dependent oxidoreductase [Autumnicola psychrophila]|uniref:SDR family oxidoreductase n=1 Tax=Autumnicola psychrophila TaxID=3075592 RepID=A0ABU3DR88_9FLAO|nr:SDR family oxidoreductase [Zunongwangia sp. F225]MDT0686231.1 SDR family oxidoreductase [Zunongwangia sp. F225]